MEKNDLLTKESMKEAISSIGKAAYTLIYDSNDTPEQRKAGKELLQAKWILATISDHVFDYYPYSYFLSDDDKKEYPEFRRWFMSHHEIGLQNAMQYVSDNFEYLDTIVRDQKNQHRIPRREKDKEAHAKQVLEEIYNNVEEIFQLLSGPKKVTDPGKPTDKEIKYLIESISRIQDSLFDYDDKQGGSDIVLLAFQYNKMLEMYKLPLLGAWQIYQYGWHSDFWKEGDSMFEYMTFQIRAAEMLPQLILSLEKESPFANFERNSIITNGLLHVYRHLQKQDLSKL